MVNSEKPLNCPAASQNSFLSDLKIEQWNYLGPPSEGIVKNFITRRFSIILFPLISTF